MSEAVEKAREAFAEAVSRVPHSGDFIAARTEEFVRAIILDVHQAGDDEPCPECGNSWRAVRGLWSAGRKASARIEALEQLVDRMLEVMNYPVGAKDAEGHDLDPEDWLAHLLTRADRAEEAEPAIRNLVQAAQAAANWLHGRDSVTVRTNLKAALAAVHAAGIIQEAPAPARGSGD